MSRRIVDGIEFFPIKNGEDQQCARCGSSVTWVQCWNCAGDGVHGHDCGEDSCCCLHPEENRPCDYCSGTGGFYRCCSGLQWCKANPLPGRETVESTAVAYAEEW